jgi:hypothetical protein
VRKKFLIALVALAVVAASMLVGCVEEAPEATPTPTPSKERELVAQYIKMHEPIYFTEYGEIGRTRRNLDTEVVIDNFMEYLRRYNIQPVEIYRQSLILYEPTYGYLYPMNYERSVTREYAYYNFDYYVYKRYNFEWVTIGSIDINKQGYGGLPKWSVEGQHYASEDIDNIRAFIEATMG